MRPSSLCICKYTTPLLTNTRFVILMHPKEYKREKIGTGRMTNLQLKNSEIIVGIDFTNNERLNEILDNKKNNNFLLYPGEDSFNLSTKESTEIDSYMGSNPHLILIDGTWSCARKMLRLSKNLQDLKKISFDNKIVSKFIIKQQPQALCLSTIESVYTVLNLLKQADLEHCKTDKFLIPFEKIIAHQIDCFLDPNNKNFPPNKNREFKPKNDYQSSSKRSILFEK